MFSNIRTKSPGRLVSILSSTVIFATAAMVHSDDSVPRNNIYAVDAEELFGSTPVQNGMMIYSSYPRGARLQASNGEAYFALVATSPRQVNTNRIMISVPEGEFPTLSVYIREEGETDINMVSKTVTQDVLIDDQEVETDYWKARTYYYNSLWAARVPGGAHFRHEYLESLDKLSDEDREPLQSSFSLVDGNRNRNETENESLRRNYDYGALYQLFSGGHAVRENLQLDRSLAVTLTGGAEMVALDTIEGVTVPEFDWKPLLPADSLEKDALARYIPHDNLAIFFANFDSLVEINNEFDELYKPLISFSPKRGENEELRQRMEHQILLSLDAFGKMAGKYLVKEVALTSGDLHWREGSDFALVFRSDNPEMIASFIDARVETLGDSIVVEKSELHGVSVVSRADALRTVSCHTAIVGEKDLIVSNSRNLLSRMITASQGRETSVADLDEYTFFRDRYKKGDKSEDALVLLTDTAIRKWTSPFWRIAQSRRIRAASVLADLTELNRDYVLTGKGDPTIPWDYVILGGGEFKFVEQEPTHSIYGNLVYMTPISEMELTEVTKDEQTGYENFFDPICLRIGVDESIEADITVMPLIEGTDYEQFRETAGLETFSADAGDRHPEALFHFIMHLDQQSRWVRFAEGNLSNFLPGVSNPMGWLGVRSAGSIYRK